MLRWLAALCCLILPAVGWGGDTVAIPALSARVTDLTGTLAADRAAALDAAMAAIEREKGAQIAILMLPTTQPETIEQFGIRLAEAWKIGRKGVSDGVIVIVAKEDRKMRLEVGYGLEGAIPDAVAKRIVAETMAPRFKQGDFAGGLDAAVAALGKIIGGEPLPAPVAAGGTGNGGGSMDGGFWLFAAIAFSGVLHSLLGLVGSLLAAGLAGALAWWLFASWFAVAVAAVLAFAFSFARGGGGLGSGGFSSSSGGGGGGGGFSGGGGGFGGGGASGDW